MFFFVVGIVVSIILMYMFYRIRKQRQLNEQLAQYNQLEGLGTARR